MDLLAAGHLCSLVTPAEGVLHLDRCMRGDPFSFPRRPIVALVCTDRFMHKKQALCGQPPHRTPENPVLPPAPTRKAGTGLP